MEIWLARALNNHYHPINLCKKKKKRRFLKSSIVYLCKLLYLHTEKSLSEPPKNVYKLQIQHDSLMFTHLPQSLRQRKVPQRFLGQLSVLRNLFEGKYFLGLDIEFCFMALLGLGMLVTPSYTPIHMYNCTVHYMYS